VCECSYLYLYDKLKSLHDKLKNTNLWNVNKYEYKCVSAMNISVSVCDFVYKRHMLSALD